MGILLSNARHALRLLYKRSGFAVVAILTLAFGIGAIMAIFTVVYAVLLRPLPFRDADRLVSVRITGCDVASFSLSDIDFLAWRSQNRIADAVAAFDEVSTTIIGDGAPERIPLSEVIDRFFDVLGARSLLGRVFEEGDDKSGAPKIVVLSHCLWMRRYQGDPAIVGRTLLLGADPHIVVGVMFSSFAFPPGNKELWCILTTNEPRRRGPFYLRGLARLKPGVLLDELRANLGVVIAGLKRQYSALEDWTLDAVPQ